MKRAIERSPQLGARIERVSNRAGAELIELTTGQTLECVARSTGSGRGFTGDTVILDEAHELDAEQLAAILPMLATRRNPQVLYALSLGNEHSTHLGALRARALARADEHICWIEWSMAEGDRIDDREVWARCNPAYPARISMEYMEREWAALGSDPEQFARERLGKSNWPADQTGRAPKYGSERTVYLADGLVTILAAHLAQHCRGDDPGRYLFAFGKDVPPHSASSSFWWKLARKTAGCTEFKLHSLRHYYASGLIAAGCDVVTVQRALGHGSATITLNTYAHLWPTAEDKTRAAAASMIAETLGAADSVRTSG